LNPHRPEFAPALVKENTVTDPTTPAPAAPGAPRTSWYRGPLLAIPILGAVLLALIIAIPLTVAAVGAAPSAHRTAVAAPTASKTGKAATTKSCWDGTSNVKGCPELTGLAGLRWIFPDADDADPATCAKVTKPFDPAGSIEVYACTWSDLPHTVAYLARYDGVEASQQDWSDYMKNTYDADAGRLTLDGEDAGIAISGATSDGTSTTSEEDVIGYDLIPYYLDVFTDIAAGGTDDEQTSVLNKRIGLRSVDDINAALDTVT
jgi:hypothetical protein